MAQNTGINMVDKEFELCVQTSFKFFFFQRKMCMGRDADGEEEEHHMKLTEKAEGSICCDMKTITLKKAKGKCWLKEAWNTKL